MKDFSNKKFEELSVLIVGLGLIGGSIARGLRLANAQQLILATDSNQESLKAAIESGVASKVGSLQEMAPQADLIVLAVPPLKLLDVCDELQDLITEKVAVTDTGSVKSHLKDKLDSIGGLLRLNFVPGHPIAGSEQSGFLAADERLFADRKVILTPALDVNKEALARVNSLCRVLGANVLGMTVSRHDEVLAATSHLPHALAYAIVEVLVKQEQSDDIFRYAAGGFADFSRLASSNPQMWSDIFIANADATETVLEHYIEQLKIVKEAISRRDHNYLITMFARSKAARGNFIDQHFNKNSANTMKSKSSTFVLAPGGLISGETRVPGDKSISHRSIILGAIADGVTKVSGFLEGEDALKTVAAFREMGVTIIGPDNGELTIFGVGKMGLQAPRKPLDMGNSGTAMRLLSGLLAAQAFESELIGDESLSSRPMNRVVKPLVAMGADITAQADGTPPLKIKPSILQGFHYEMPMASAQVKSCLLLAGLYAQGKTRVEEPAKCRDHTERMLKGFSYPLEVAESGGVCVESVHELKATDIDVPGDISSAAFFLVAAAITPGADLVLKHVGVNPTRIGVLNVLIAMGANIELSNEALVGGEPVADIRVRHSELNGIVISETDIPLAIDEFPVLFIAAACAQGETSLRGAEELRVKESDRIAAMAAGLTTLGVKLQVFPDGIDIEGGQLGGGEVESFDDHRIAMAFSVASLRASEQITVLNCTNVATSFPNFVELSSSLGLNISCVVSQ